MSRSDTEIDRFINKCNRELTSPLGRKRKYAQLVRQHEPEEKVLKLDVIVTYDAVNNNYEYPLQIVRYFLQELSLWLADGAMDEVTRHKSHWHAIMHALNASGGNAQRFAKKCVQLNHFTQFIKLYYLQPDNQAASVMDARWNSLMQYDQGQYKVAEQLMRVINKYRIFAAKRAMNQNVLNNFSHLLQLRQAAKQHLPASETFLQLSQAALMKRVIIGSKDALWNGGEQYRKQLVDFLLQSYAVDRKFVKKLVRELIVKKYRDDKSFADSFRVDDWVALLVEGGWHYSTKSPWKFWIKDHNCPCVVQSHIEQHAAMMQRAVTGFLEQMTLGQERSHFSHNYPRLESLCAEWLLLADENKVADGQIIDADQANFLRRRKIQSAFSFLEKQSGLTSLSSQFADQVCHNIYEQMYQELEKIANNAPQQNKDATSAKHLKLFLAGYARWGAAFQHYTMQPPHKHAGFHGFEDLQLLLYTVLRDPDAQMRLSADLNLPQGDDTLLQLQRYFRQDTQQKLMRMQALLQADPTNPAITAEQDYAELAKFIDGYIRLGLAHRHQLLLPEAVDAVPDSFDLLERDLVMIMLADSRQIDVEQMEFLRRRQIEILQSCFPGMSGPKLTDKLAQLQSALKQNQPQLDPSLTQTPTRQPDQISLLSSVTGRLSWLGQASPFRSGSDTSSLGDNEALHVNRNATRYQSLYSDSNMRETIRSEVTRLAGMKHGLHNKPQRLKFYFIMIESIKKRYLKLSRAQFASKYSDTAASHSAFNRDSMLVLALVNALAQAIPNEVEHMGVEPDADSRQEMSTTVSHVFCDARAMTSQGQLARDAIINGIQEETKAAIKQSGDVTWIAATDCSCRFA